MGKTNTKKMVQGAMIAAMFGVLSLLNTYTGSMFDVFICYVMVIPLVWYGYAYTLKDNIVVSFVAMVVIAMVGLPFFVISSISSCLAGLFIGEALKRKVKKETILMGTLLVTFLNNILLYEVFSGLLGMNLVAEMREMYQMLIEIMPSLASQLTVETVISMIPIILIIMSVLEMYVIILLCQIVLSRFKIKFPGSFHIAMLHFGYKTGVFLAIIMFGSYLLKSFTDIESVYLSYAYTLTTLAFAVEGLAFFTWLTILKKKPKLMILVFIGIFIPLVNTFYVIVGIVDIFSDLRGNLLYNGHDNN